MILVIANNSNARLCQDGKYRDFATFGTMPWCVKQYKTVGGARCAAKRKWGRVIKIDNPNMWMEATGTILEKRPHPDKPCWEKVVFWKPAHFLI